MALFDPYQDPTAALKLPQMPADPTPKKGLFSSLGGLLAKADTADANGLTFWDRLGNVSASLRDDPAYRQMAYEQNAAKSQSYKSDALQKQALEQANAQADGLGLQGRERLVFMANPEAWAKENATRYGVTNVAPGSLATNAGANGESIYNPKTSFEGQYATATNPDGSIRITGERPMTYDEQNAQARLAKPDYQAFSPESNVMQVNPYAVGTTTGQQPGYTPSGALPPADAVAPLLTQAIPGLRITGLGRDPSRNAQVGGVSNSMHLDNHAIDMVLPPNVQPDQVVAMLRQNGINPTEVLNEGQVGNQGAHLHVGWRPKGQQAAQPQQGFAPQMVQAASRTPEWVTLSPEEKAAGGYSPDSVVQKNLKTGKVEIGSGANAQQKADRQGQMQLRKEFDGLPDVKNYNIVASQYQNIKKFARDNSGSNDIGLIFSYMKMLDPTSVVREGEYATAQQTGGIPASIVNQYNKAVNGQFLTPAQRMSYVSTAKSVHDNARQRYDEVLNQYHDYGSQSGYDPNFIQGRAAPKEDDRTANGGLAGATDAQHQRYAKVFKKGTSYGSATNPYLVRNQGEYDALKNGQWFIDDDGALAQKK